MKRDDLIKMLQRCPENLPVVVDVNGHAYEVLCADVLIVPYYRQFGNKLICECIDDQKVIFIGNIGNTDIEDYKLTDIILEEPIKSI